MQAHSSDHINHQAREWFVTLQSGSVSQQQRDAFERWLADAEHASAYAQYEEIWRDLGALATSQAGRELQASVQPPAWRQALGRWWQTRQPVWYGLAGTALTCLLVVAVVVLPAAPDVAHYATAKAQQQEIHLPDGSSVTLGARSQMRVWQTDSGRFVELVSGVAFFDVAKDRQRPFYVQAADVRVRVVGTQFDIQHRQRGVRVAVREGLVQVADAEQPLSAQLPAATPTAIDLSAGESVERFRGGDFQPVAQVQAAGDWRSGQLVYRNAPLADVVADANRYFSGEIVIGSPVLAQARVTLALRTDEIEQFPALIEQTMPVSLYREAGSRIVILAKADALH